MPGGRVRRRHSAPRPRPASPCIAHPRPASWASAPAPRVLRIRARTGSAHHGPRIPHPRPAHPARARASRVRAPHRLRPLFGLNRVAGRRKQIAPQSLSAAPPPSALQQLTAEPPVWRFGRDAPRSRADSRGRAGSKGAAHAGNQHGPLAENLSLRHPDHEPAHLGQGFVARDVLRP